MTNRKRSDRVHEHISPIPPEKKKKMLPDLVIKLLTGAKVIENYKNKPDSCCVVWNAEEEPYHIEDIKITKMVADAIWKEQVEEKNLITTLSSLPTVLFLREIAQKKIEKIVDYKVTNKKKVIFIKDRTGCGYWRFIVPIRYMSNDDYFIDVCESEVVYDFLLEYDIVVVQRLYTWPEYYTIERLKRHGKKIVYDIDDDIYNIPPHNPASMFIRQDQVEAAKEIMKSAHVITTTTDILKENLGYPQKTVIIPNSLDIDEYPAKYNPSNDGWKRILWMGSATHHEDWKECADAVDRIMKEDDKVRLTILGSLPNIIRSFLEDVSRPWWDGRIEFSEFKEIESYVSITKNMMAEVALAPLNHNKFNQSKSCLKFVEYASCGFPCIASDVSPYKEVILNGNNGFLARTHDDWYKYIKLLLNDKDEAKKIVNSAVDTVKRNFNIVENVKLWEKAIFS